MLKMCSINNRLSFRTVAPKKGMHQKPNEYARHSSIKRQIMLYLEIRLRLRTGECFYNSHLSSKQRLKCLTIDDCCETWLPGTDSNPARQSQAPIN